MMNATVPSPGLIPRSDPRSLGRPAASPDRTRAERACLIHLLVVDDDVAVIEYLGQLLRGFAQVSFATNGEDASDRLRKPSWKTADPAATAVAAAE